MNEVTDSGITVDLHSFRKQRVVISIAGIVLSCIVFTDDALSTKIKEQDGLIIDDVIDDVLKT